MAQKTPFAARRKRKIKTKNVYLNLSFDVISQSSTFAGDKS